MRLQARISNIEKFEAFDRFAIPVVLLLFLLNFVELHAQGRSSLRPHVVAFRARAYRAGRDPCHVKCRAAARPCLWREHAGSDPHVDDLHRPNSRASMTLLA